MSKDNFENVFLLTEGAEPPALNTIPKADIERSVSSEFKFDPTREYGAWATPDDAMLIWELFEYMRQIVPKECRRCIEIVVKRDEITIGWLYSPNPGVPKWERAKP